MRDTWQIRTLPERVEEWLLLFIPLDLFERGLQQLGADAKVVALQVTIVGMAALLVAIGVLALRAAGPAGGCSASGSGCGCSPWPSSCRSPAPASSPPAC